MSAVSDSTVLKVDVSDDVTIKRNGQAFSVEVKTQNLFIRTIQGVDRDHYEELYSTKYKGEGFELRFNKWMNSQNAFAIFKEQSEEFIGSILLHISHDVSSPGIAEMRVELATQGKQHLREAIEAFIKKVFPKLMDEKFDAAGEPLCMLQTATSDKELGEIFAGIMSERFDGVNGSRSFTYSIEI